MENWIHLFEERSSVRSFLPDPVEREKIMALCDIATKAPTACNLQQWRFTVITDSALKQRIVDEGGSRLIATAPVGILVSYARDTKNILYRDYVQSAAAAVENMLLAAPQLGLGACWICNLPTKRTLRKLFHIHPKFEAIAYVIVGYPVRQTKPMPRRHKIEDLVGDNMFPELAEDRAYSPFKTFLGRCAVLVYRYSPRFLKKAFLNRLVDSGFTKKFDK